MCLPHQWLPNGYRLRGSASAGRRRWSGAAVATVAVANGPPAAVPAAATAAADWWAADGGPRCAQGGSSVDAIAARAVTGGTPTRLLCRPVSYRFALCYCGVFTLVAASQRYVWFPVCGSPPVSDWSWFGFLFALLFFFYDSVLPFFVEPSLLCLFSSCTPSLSPLPQLDTHRVLGTPIHSDAYYRTVSYEIAYFGAGCFWSLERVFWDTPGVVSTAVGYQGGDADVVNPSYRAVCSGEAGFAEVVKVVYDPSVLSYGAAVDVWLAAHDPTTVDRQGADTGVQYRSVVFCEGERQRVLVEERLAHFESLLSERRAVVAAAVALESAPADAATGGVRGGGNPAVTAAAAATADNAIPPSPHRRTRPPGGVEGDTVVTVVADAAAYPFYYAELYHQQYLSENPWASCPSNANSVYVPPPP